MKRILIGLLVWMGFAWGQITTIPNAAQILGIGGLSCSLGVCTVEAAAANPSTLIVKATAGQGTADLVQVKNAAGTTLTYVKSGGGIVVPGEYLQGFIAGQASLQDGLFLGGAKQIFWSADAYFNGPTTVGISKTSTGRAQFNSGTAGQFATLDLGNLMVNSIATPGAPTVTKSCPDGTCNQTWSYTAEDLGADKVATTIPGAVGSTTADQAATLDATHFNTLTGTCSTGATFKRYRRTVSGGTPATLGVIGTVACGTTLVDNGLVGDASSAPEANTTGRVTAANMVASSTSIAPTTYAYNFCSQSLGCESGASAISFPASGVVLIPEQLQMGGSTAAFPGIMRDGAGIKVRDATNAAYAPLTSGTLRVTATASSTLTGTADPTASTTLVGTGTLFLTELIVGDRVTVNAETRTVTAIATDLSLTVDIAFTDTAAASVTRLPAMFVARDSTGAVKMLQDSTGNVGIGTTGPATKLDVNGEITASTGLRFSGSSGTVITDNGALNLRAGAANAQLLFYGGSNEYMRINTSGNVGIGTTSPDRLLHAELQDTGTNTVSYVQRLTHGTSGTAAAGFGSGSEVELENASGTNRVASTTETTWETATDAAEDAIWNLRLMVAGSLAAAGRVTKSQTYWGVGAGASNTGTDPSMFGFNAGLSNSGHYPALFGFYAGASNTGVGPSMFGAQAGQSNTGSEPSMFGYFSGNANTGIQPSMFGYQAGYQNTGDYAAMFGYQAGYQNTGGGASAFGVSAGYRNAGAISTFFGVNRGLRNNWDNVTLLGARTATTFQEDATTTKNITEANITGANTITYVAHGFGTVGGKVNIIYKLTGGAAPVGLVHNTVYQFTVTSADVLTLAGIAAAPAAFTGTLTNSMDVHNSIAVGVDAVPTKAHQAVLGNTDIVETVLRGAVAFSTIAEPSCAAATRGQVVYVAGGAGVADTFRVCAKSILDAYAWTALY